MNSKIQVLKWLDKEFDLFKEEQGADALAVVIYDTLRNGIFEWASKKLEEMGAARVIGSACLRAMIKWDGAFLDLMKKIGITAKHCIQAGALSECLIRGKYKLLEWIYENEKEETRAECQKNILDLLDCLLKNRNIRSLDWLKKIGITLNGYWLAPHFKMGVQKYWAAYSMPMENTKKCEQWLCDMGHPL